MKRLSDRVRSLSESATIAMTRRSRELKEQGEDVISLSLGEPDFDTPEFIREAGKSAIDQGFTRYPPVNGYARLRETICRKFSRDNDLHFEPGQIVVSTGAKQSIANIVLSLVDAGDEVLLPAPYWVSYYDIVKLAGGIPVVLDGGIGNGLKPTPEQIASAITDRTRVFLFSSPCNPSGSTYGKEELQAIAGVLEDHPDIYVVADEIYEYINFDTPHFSIGSIPSISDRVITVNGVSKGFAMTGWRIGFMGGPGWLAEGCTKLQGQFTSGAAGISQKAAEAAIEAGPSAVKEMVNAFAKRRELVWELLEGIEGWVVNKPSGAFYFFPDVSECFGTSWEGWTIRNATDLSFFLLEEARVSTVTGEAFGKPECLRLSYAVGEEDLRRAMERIQKAIGKLTPQ